MISVRRRSIRAGLERPATGILLCCAVFGCALFGCAHPPPVPRMTHDAAEGLRAAANQALESHVAVVTSCVEQARRVGDLSTANGKVMLLPVDEGWVCAADAGAAVCTFATCMRAKSKDLGLPVVSSRPELSVFVYLRGPKAVGDPRPVYPGTEPLLSVGDVSVLKNVGFLWPPQRLSGEPLDYSFAAQMEGTEGRLVVKCWLNEQGALSDCHVLKEVVHLTDSNLERLKTWRFKPARWNDSPVAVDYVFRVNFTMAP
jgi:TonB family protein